MQENKKSLDPVKTETAKIALPPGGFKLECGKNLPELQVAYETYGRLSRTKNNAVFICHALTGDAHVAGYHSATRITSEENGREIPGWWDEMVGPGKGIDTDHYFVVCANILGGCKGTTGPSSINPATGKPYGSAFPKITVCDIITVHQLLLKQLGIKHLSALIGGSLGGMQVLEWAIKYPESMDRCICIASAANLSAQALAFDVIGRNAIMSDKNWNNGDYYSSENYPDQGLGLARKIGHITYLSQEMMTKKFGREKKESKSNDENNKTIGQSKKFQSDFQIESYLEYQSKKFVKRFDANSYLHISEAMDEFDLSKRFGGLEKAFKPVKAKFLAIALSKDWLFPPEQSIEIVNALLQSKKQISFCKLYAPHGHDAFLVDIKHLAQAIKAFLPWVEKETAAPSEIISKDSKTKTQSQSQSQSQKSDQERFKFISQMISPKTRVLDLGCGNGELLDILKNKGKISGLGVDLDIENIISVIDRGHDVLHADIDAGLEMIPDKIFDYAILSETLQVVHKPRKVLKELLRVAKEGIVSFPNFGKWTHRFRILKKGRMPKEGALPFEWYNTPNIHLFTLIDFFELCRSENVKILEMVCIGGGIISKALIKGGLCNLGADRAIVRITSNESPDQIPQQLKCKGSCCNRK